MQRHLQLIAALALVACTKREATPAPEVREIENPPAPPAFSPIAWPTAAPKWLGAPGADAPAGCTNWREAPSSAEWPRLLETLDHAPDDDVELSVLADGCARLRQLRAGGSLARWQLRRFTGSACAVAAEWDFAAGVTRPTVIGRYSLTVALDRPNEWAREELRHKHFVRFANDGGTLDETDLVRYPNEPALYREGKPPWRISSTTPTATCRTDGSNHCDRLEQLDRMNFEAGTAY